MKRIAIFASGSGTNAQKIIEHFANNQFASVNLILSNNKDAYVLERANKHKIQSVVFNRHDFYNTDKIISLLDINNIDFIVLAGFLWLIPTNLINHYPNKIINIHPALLPKYGGKGMYGNFVHEAVIKNQETESGITIHYVNENYDEGNIIFQAKCPVLTNDTPDTLAKRIHELEYKYFPEVIEGLIGNL